MTKIAIVFGTRPEYLKIKSIFDTIFISKIIFNIMDINYVYSVINSFNTL
jgi:UDP-N-acetylglucosamine 2-epimerase